MFLGIVEAIPLLTEWQGWVTSGRGGVDRRSGRGSGWSRIKVGGWVAAAIFFF